MLLSAYANLYAFDGERNGFILGGGIGAGYLSKSTSYNSYSVIDNRGVFLTNFKIGHALNNTLELYCIYKASWWSETEITYGLALLALAVTFYTDTETETGLCISGGLGLSTLGAPFEHGSNPAEGFGGPGAVNSSTGFGCFGGVGYEFTDHWIVELDMHYSAISESGSDLSCFGVQLTINVLAY
jgi:opacity protein-like surface antigen